MEFYENFSSNLIFFFFAGSTAPVGPVLFFSFMIIFTEDRTPWTSDQIFARPLPKYRTTQTQNKHIHTHQTSMPFVGFEPRIPVSERAKTVHALDRSATVTGNAVLGSINEKISANTHEGKEQGSEGSNLHLRKRIGKPTGNITTF
jgi:hypothetical protein